MGKRVASIAICVFVAVGAGAVIDVAVEIVRSPKILWHLEFLWGIVVNDAFVYASVPVAFLAVRTLFKPTPSISLSVLVVVGWLTAIFALWVYKPVVHHGIFPWWGFRLHYLGMLPVSLAVGLAFAFCARTLVGPNNRLERSRGASSVG